MSEIKIKKCDICGSEQRSDQKPPPYWADVYSEKITICFKNAPNIQCDFNKDSLCSKCSSLLRDCIVDAIEFVRSENSI